MWLSKSGMFFFNYKYYHQTETSIKSRLISRCDHVVKNFFRNDCVQLIAATEMVRNSYVWTNEWLYNYRKISWPWENIRSCRQESLSPNLVKKKIGERNKRHQINSGFFETCWWQNYAKITWLCKIPWLHINGDFSNNVV